MRERISVVMNEHVLMRIKEITRANSRIMYLGMCINMGFRIMISVYSKGMERS